MTFKSILNWADSKGYLSPSGSDRYHSGPWDSSGSWQRGSGWKSKSGVSGAAISALALLAFLFFLNTMQQTMMDTTMMNAMSDMETATILLRSPTKKYKDEEEEAKKPVSQFDIESDNVFWNSQRLEVDPSGTKNVKNTWPIAVEPN